MSRCMLRTYDRISGGDVRYVLRFYDVCNLHINIATRSDKYVGLLSMMQQGSTDVTSRRKAYTEINPTGARGVAKGGPVGPGTPPPIQPHYKLLRIKRVRTRHALRIRLTEL